MKYRLILEVTDIEYRADAFVELYYPDNAQFSTHNIIGNALSQFVVLLLGETLGELEELKNPIGE